MRLRAAAVWVPALLWALPTWAQVPAGGSFTVSETAGTGPVVAMASSSEFVVVWSDYVARSPYSDVWARRYDRAGAALGAPFLVNTYTSGCQGRPRGIDAASDPKGDVIVVWQSVGCSNPSPPPGIFAQRLTRSGARVGGEFRVDGATGQPFRVTPRVASSGAGQTIVVWRDEGYGPLSQNTVYAKRLGATGETLGAQFAVDAGGTYRRNAPRVTAGPAGDFVIVWERFDLGYGRNHIVARRYDGAGVPRGAEIRVDTSSDQTGNATVRAQSGGGFVVTWISGPTNGCCALRMRRFDAAGTPQGAETAIAPSVASEAAIAVDGADGFVVVWTERTSHQLRGQRFDAIAAPRGAEFVLSGAFGYPPAAASDPAGNFVVSWDNGSVFGLRFGGLQPRPAAVDSQSSSSSDGNGLLEPGETADVAPRWRNANGAAQTFAGAATSFTGPPASGVSYTLLDAAASYGTVADGATAQCTDCYSVGTTFSGTRPAQHWDAALVERITPDALGQTARWSLHIGDSFGDVPRTSPFYRFVETLLHSGVTGGCTAANFCPTASLPREQAAVVMLAAQEGAGYRPPGCTTPLFSDVPAASPYCPFIEELARRGVAGGCGGGRFCPSSSVSRAEIAVFVLHTLDPALAPPPCTPPNLFSDVPETSPFCRWIEELAERGVAGGCGGGRYCPDAAVTREQMAVFVAQAFGLSLYGPE